MRPPIPHWAGLIRHNPIREPESAMAWRRWDARPLLPSGGRANAVEAGENDRQKQLASACREREAEPSVAGKTGVKVPGVGRPAAGSS